MNDSFFQFAHPMALGLLFLLPLYIWALVKSKKKVSKIDFSNISLLNDFKRTYKQRFTFLSPLLITLSLILGIIALSRPQYGNKVTENLTQGVDIFLSIDTSGSMRALDFKIDGKRVDRMNVVKSVVKDFVSQRPYDRIGMVVFGNTAYTQCPLTTDQKSIATLIDWAEVGMAGENTAIGDGIARSLQGLKNSEAKSKIIILLSDGQNTAGSISPETATQMASKMGIKIYTIAVGQDGYVPYPQKTPFGTQIIKANIAVDKELLKDIATKTGGHFFEATDTEQLKKIYSIIDSMEKTEIKIKEYSNYRELFVYPLIACILVFLLGIVLNETILMRLP